MLELSKLHPKSSKGRMGYGTAGFRGDASSMDHIFFRMGLLATLRSKSTNAAIAVMVTASHNPENDNGVKLIDPKGEMLSEHWEAYASVLGNSTNESLVDDLKKIIDQEKIDFAKPAIVLLGRDTRPSSPILSEAVRDGVNALMGTVKDFGLLTTPQLHYMVACYNNGQLDVSEDDYYKQFATAFKDLIKNMPVSSPVTVDCAHGIGAPKLRKLGDSLGAAIIDIVVHNEGSGTGRLNEKCGADYVKVQQKAPIGLMMEPFSRYGSFDGDADRLVYYTLDSDCSFILLDGDKIAALFAGYIKELLTESGLELKLGVVQTAYANGTSTKYLNEELQVEVACTRTGVKHLHHVAKTFDIGVYFEANGHGTVTVKPTAMTAIRSLASQTKSDCPSTDTKSTSARMLLHLLELINPTVGDAMCDLLAVEAILHLKNWNLRDWSSVYTELPNRQLKVKVADRTVIITTDAERQVTAPTGLQEAINNAVKQFPQARSFVRPSGTEDVVRVYAESDTQENTDKLAELVGSLVYDLANGQGDRPVVS